LLPIGRTQNEQQIRLTFPDMRLMGGDRVRVFAEQIPKSPTTTALSVLIER
jgi:hypothetical protein